MARFKRSAVTAAVAVAVSAVTLYWVRGELAEVRASLGKLRDARGEMWDNYILSEQRSSAAAILIAERDSFGIASAVEHTRGAFNAISAAAGEQTPALAQSLLGGGGPLHEAPLALELAQQRFDAYNTLKQTMAPLQGRTLERVKVYRKEIERLEARVGRLSRMETAAFLLAVFCVLVLNLAGAQRDRA